MKSLRNVGEIRYVIDVPSDRRSLENTAEKVKGYDFQETVSDLQQVQEAVKQDRMLFDDTDWQVLFNEKDTKNAISLIRESKYKPTLFAFVWFKENNNPEIGLGYMEPRLAWLEQVKEEEQKDETQSLSKRQNSSYKDAKTSLEHSHTSEKHRNSSENSNIDKNNQNTDKDDNNQDSKQLERIESEIDRTNLKILLEARLSNILIANDLNRDYQNIIQGYTELDGLLKKIHSEETLRQNRDILPYEFSDKEIDDIIQSSRIKEINKESHKEDIPRNLGEELDRILE